MALNCALVPLLQAGNVYFWPGSRCRALIKDLRTQEKENQEGFGAHCSLEELLSIPSSPSNKHSPCK